MTTMRVTIHDLEGLPMDDGNRYEIIDGEFHVTHQPHSNHQLVCAEIIGELRAWNKETKLGVVMDAPGVVFANDDVVAPDVVWMSKERHAAIYNPDGKLYGAPELVVEILSPGAANENRDRNLKYKLYSRRGVSEYWIVNWQKRQIEVFRRDPVTLNLEQVQTVYETDTLRSPNLPGFTCAIQDIFANVFQ